MLILIYKILLLLTYYLVDFVFLLVVLVESETVNYKIFWCSQKEVLQCSSKVWFPFNIGSKGFWRDCFEILLTILKYLFKGVRLDNRKVFFYNNQLTIVVRVFISFFVYMYIFLFILVLFQILNRFLHFCFNHCVCKC